MVCMVVVVVVGLIFFGENPLLVMELEYSGVGFWLVRGGLFRLGGVFVVVVDVLEVVVEVND